MLECSRKLCGFHKETENDTRNFVQGAVEVSIMDDSVLFQLREETRDNMKKLGLLDLDPSAPVEPPSAYEDYLFPRRPEIGIITHEPEANRTGMHSHDFFEITYVVHGDCRQTFDDGRTVIFHKGNMCIMNPDIQHSCEIDSWRDYVVNIMISSQLFNSAFFSFFEKSNSISTFFTSYLLSSSTSSYMTFMCPYDPETDMLMNQLLKCYLENGIYMITEVRCYLILLFSKFLQNIKNNTPGEDISRMTEIVEYMDAHLQTVTLKSTAEHFHYHPNYLSSYMKKHSGKNFQEILTDLRLVQAKYYLTSTDLPVSQIAGLLGYQDISSFNVMFRNHLHRTPSEFRDASSGV